MFVAVSRAEARKLSVLGFSLQNVISTADHVNLSGIISSPKTYRNVHFKKKETCQVAVVAAEPDAQKASSVFLKFFVRLL